MVELANASAHFSVADCAVTLSRLRDQELTGEHRPLHHPRRRFKFAARRRGATRPKGDGVTGARRGPGEDATSDSCNLTLEVVVALLRRALQGHEDVRDWPKYAHVTAQQACSKWLARRSTHRAPHSSTACSKTD